MSVYIHKIRNVYMVRASYEDRKFHLFHTVVFYGDQTPRFMFSLCKGEDIFSTTTVEGGVLDEEGAARATGYYGKRICDQCTAHITNDTSLFLNEFGDEV
ncbi:hypothetical protein CH373_09145 [Leptospira perolatii]|uniref:Uncharacterized protein n=1 Tax=Leptospira perolatii TaxID=2023191 RepID=A0A2M9ZNJ5_9LEPT|nr:hypothetical protein [Leptospira perolatii]PJZ69655.1 hypothetical protein CH360_10290 [Leptospira perolatii]PJZ73642.1 hypothetical protein CH373_09145 [Leptospira perolatii]